jgi:membrane protease YdiL (CAAX protease family)
MNKFSSFTIIAILIYFVWTLVTYFLEGRVDLLHKNDPVGRLEYTIIANIIIGIVLPLIFVKYALSAGLFSTKQIGLRSIPNTVILTAVTGVTGFFLFYIQGPSTLNSLAITNVFLQTLPVSIAEVIVCWVIVGASVESLTNNRLGKKTSVILGLLISTAAFGIYHFAHSAPFNQPQLVFFLMLPGVLTSVVFFLGRNLYATIIFHNFQALFGVLASVPLSQMLQIQIPIVLLAGISIVTLIIIDKLVLRKFKFNASRISKDRAPS